MDRVITYGLEEDFIQNLSSLIDKEYLKEGRDLSSLAFVFGGKRPSLFLKKELSDKIKKGFLPPRFFSIDEFIEYTLSKKEVFSKITDLDASYIIYTLTQELAPDILRGREGFSQFLPWAREILAFIEQLDFEDINIKSLKDIQLNAAIGYDVPENINTLLTHIVLLRDAFANVLVQKKAYPRGLMYLFASRYVSEARFDEFDDIFFCNFFYLHKTEERVIKNLYDNKKAILVFAGDEREWPVLEKVSKSFSCSIQTKASQKPAYELSIQAGFDLHSQVCLVREVLKKIKNPNETVIVLPEPGHIVPLLSEIASSVEDFNVSLGYPLTRSSLYSLFECIFKAQETKKDGQYYTRDYLRALSHPLIKNLSIIAHPAVTRILVHKIEEILLGVEETSLGGSLFTGLSDIEALKDLYELALDTMKGMDIKVTAEELRKIILELHHSLFYLWEDTRNFYDFAQGLEKFLDLLVRKGFLNRYPLDLKIAERIFSIQKELMHSSFNKEVFSQEEIFKIFKNKLDNEVISFSGSPLRGLQILGALETRSLTFENVIIMDANESILPKLKIYEPLIPRDIMMSLGLNRLEKEEEIQRYQFRRLISGAKNVYLIYQEGKDKEKSRFIEELIWEKEKSLNALDVLPIPKASFKVRVFPKAIEIKKRPQEVAFLKDCRYSASSVNTYINCPLRFYYRYVLGLEEKEDLWDEPQAADIGNFVHELLEEVFSKFVSKPPHIDARFKKYFFNTLDKKFENEFKRKMKSDAFLIKEILDFRLEKFLANEKTRRIKEILCLEKPFEERIMLGGSYFKFKCRIDRIDRLQDDSLLIIDYKTGGSDIMPSNGGKVKAAGFSRQAIKNNIKSFQLPLYYYFVQHAQKVSPVNAAFYNLRNLEKNSGLDKLFDDEDDPAYREEAMGIFIKALETVVFEILDPEMPFTADEEDMHYCRHCPFFYLCR